MWRSLYPRMFFRSSVHCSSSSTIPSPYHVRSSFSLSSPNYSSAASSPRMKGSVWWNLENHCLPSGFDLRTVLDSLERALEDNGLKRVKVNIFCDISQLPTNDRDGLISILENFNHIPKGGNETVQSFLIFDLLDWVSQNPAPYNLYFLPPVDSNLDSVLQHLKRNNYNVWLATVETMDPEIRKKMDSSMVWRLRSY